MKGETGSCPDGQGHAQWMFNPIFCWWVGLCSLPVIYLGPNYGGGNEDNGDLLKRSMQAPLHSVPPTQQQATANSCLCRRLLDTHRQVWVSLLWGHCSFLLGPGAHKVLFVPSKSLYPQSCVSSGGSMVGLMATSSKRAYAIIQVCCTQSPAPVAVHYWPVPQ